MTALVNIEALNAFTDEQREKARQLRAHADLIDSCIDDWERCLGDWYEKQREEF